MHTVPEIRAALKALKQDKKSQYNSLLNNTAVNLVETTPEIEDTILDICIGVYNAGPSAASDICLALGLLFVEEDVS